MLPLALAAAASRIPSLEEAMELQRAAGTLDGAQVAPPLVEA